MNTTRRQTLQAAGAGGLMATLAAFGLSVPVTARAQGVAGAFQAKSVSDALKGLGAAAPTESKDVVINSPDIAENGAVVPVAIKSNIPKTESIMLLVDKNPQPLAGAYDVLAGMEPEVSSRIKMGQSSDVIALVKADGKYYMAKKEIKITLGGCGG